MNQQQIVNRINQLGLGNRLTWYDIMYDADKAILRINSYLGATYPKMSEVLVSPDHTYSFYMDGAYHEIFPEVYIHTIIIPFIAAEVLSRDEEFTTVYNKYMTEVEDGLFTMFQNEFYKVPKNFRHSKSVGVFFGNEQIERRITDDMEDNATVFKFRIYYHINNDDIVQHVPIYTELSQILYNQEYVVQGYNPQYFSDNDNVYMSSCDGTHYYKFTGWRLTKELINEILEPDTTITVKHDIHLYAQWDKFDTLSINDSGAISIATDIPNVITSLITTLILPVFYNGLPVRSISNNFCGTDKPILPYLSEVYISELVDTIGSNAFKYFNGTSIEFSYSKVPITINPGAFNFNVENSKCNVGELLIPLNVQTITVDSTNPVFNCATDKLLTVNFRRLFTDIPDSFNHNSNGFAGENVVIRWGYNG